ncbi:MAG: ATP-NAD kinase family protein [Thermoplasmata archaeon]|nr:ATP-NAD kinase family protein [Thermoplasmata archaeon]
MATKIGFVVNPIAGMGGRVALKGTDGTEARDEAVRRGAVAWSPGRARRALKALLAKRLDLDILTCSDEMGELLLDEEGFQPEVVCHAAPETTAEDTKRAARAFLERGADLLLFCGGDGTAKDIVEVVDSRVPIVGIPAGVKMHSSVFAVRPEEAADLVESYVRTGKTRDAEVMDIDENDFRRGISNPRLFALALVPDDERHLQASKSAFQSLTASDEAEELAVYVVETMKSGVLYIIGPGSTTQAIAMEMAQDKTPLGVDAYLDRELVAQDLSENDILAQIRRHPEAVIIVTPIGAQGFIFGRGNQQISSEVIREVGLENIIVVATPTKLNGTATLRVDTGDSALDVSLRKPLKILTGYRRRKLVGVV